MVVLEEVEEEEVMLMLGQAEALGPGLDHSHTAMISKGKRTKRQRPHSPLALSLVSYTSSSGHGGGDDRVVTSPEPMATSGGELDGKIVKEDEEDNEAGIAANCLMLMSQGRTQCKQPEMGIKAATATARTANNGFDAYQCRTCDRCFPSFQALGGHRASHKKPKGGVNLEDKKPPPSTSHGSLEDGGLIRNDGGNKSSSPPLTTSSLLPLTNNSIKSCRVHECGICGAEFASGQALGGHMRRHRMTVGGSGGGGGATTRNTEEDFLLRQSPSPAKKKSKSVVLSLDLNLAPPEESKFAPFAKEHTLVFSASPLVDCHY